MGFRKFALVATLAFVFANVAIAQQKTGPNGGLIGGKDGHEVELIVSPTELTVFLIDDGKPHSTKGANVKAVVQDAGKATTIELKDMDNKKLVGTLAAPLGKGAIVVVTGKDGHGHSISARYVPK
jgi:hypothetical protein